MRCPAPEPLRQEAVRHPRGSVPPGARFALSFGVLFAAMAGGCDSTAPPSAAPVARSGSRRQSVPDSSIDLPQPAQRLGTAVVVLVDTSGSMSQTVRNHAGQQSPKHEIARSALARIMRVTDDWHKRHTEMPLFLGIISFFGICSNVLPMAPFDAAQAQAALQKTPHPGGGTAIGLALEQGFKALYGTGCVRKHLVCITDGENTVATPPDLMARRLYAETKGEVEIHFVAFDTAARQFAFLTHVNGSAVEAADGEQLKRRLTELYEKRILVEAMPAEKE